MSAAPVSMTVEFVSRDLEIRDTPKLAEFAPAEWQVALDAVLLQHFGPGGALDGFFLPTLGSGLVLAREPAAGQALLGFKHALYSSSAVVPASNRAALEFLRNRGAEETSRAPRMALGNEAAWRPECVFGRAAGYCG